jgi:hypothetical protein
MHKKMRFSLRRHYPEQVYGYYLSLQKESTPDIQLNNKRALKSKYMK